MYYMQELYESALRIMKREVIMDDFANFNGGKKNGKNTADDFMKQAQSAAARYNGKNENELVGEIFARAAEGKKNGSLTNAEIDAFYQQIAPMLDGGKRKKLQKLVEKLKSM